MQDFKKLLTARFLYTFAVQMQAVLLGWRMYTLTHDPLYLGLIGLVEAIPALGLALYAGYIVDRSRPLVVYRRLLYASFLSALIMLVSQHEAAQMTERLQIIALFASSFLTGTARAFSQPTIYASVPRLVERNFLQRASAWTTTSLQIARISGPALGGLLFGWIGITATSGIVCGILLLALGAMLLIQRKIEPPAVTGTPNSLRHELFSGAVYVFKHPILLPALSLDMLSVMFGGVTALLPIYAAEILHVGPKGLGLLRAAPAIGAAITGLWLTSFEIRQRAGTWLLTSVTAFGLFTIVFAISTNYLLSLASLALLGAFDSVSMVIRGTAVQLTSPDHMRGRISAVNSIFIGSSNELGEFESGVAARWLGTVPAALLGGIACMLIVSVVAWRCPRLRQMNLDNLSAT